MYGSILMKRITVNQFILVSCILDILVSCMPILIRCMTICHHIFVECMLCL